MHTKKLLTTLMLGAGLQASAQAAPVIMTQSDPGRTYNIYSLFSVDAGLGVSGWNLILPDLQRALAAVDPTGMRKPCQVSGDLNASNIRCGTGNQQMQLGGNEIFSYDRNPQITAVPLDRKTFPNLKFVNPSMASNGRTAAFIGDPAADSSGRIATIHFTGRMAQFGMLVDSGINAAMDSIQFIVNGQALPPQTFAPGEVKFVGVQDPNGFTDLTIVTTGTAGIFVADQFTLLPLANF